MAVDVAQAILELNVVVNKFQQSKIHIHNELQRT